MVRLDHGLSIAHSRSDCMCCRKLSNHDGHIAVWIHIGIDLQMISSGSCLHTVDSCFCVCDAHADVQSTCIIVSWASGASDSHSNGRSNYVIRVRVAVPQFHRV